VVYRWIAVRSGDVASGVDSPRASGCSSRKIEEIEASLPELERVIVNLGKSTGVSIAPTPDNLAGTVDPKAPSAYRSWNVDGAERAIYQHEAVRNIVGVLVEADKTTETVEVKQR
jgi:hypothetical protein